MVLSTHSDESRARDGARELVVEEAIQWCASDHEFVNSDKTEMKAPTLERATRDLRKQYLKTECCKFEHAVGKSANNPAIVGIC